jgi:hypothetical protein
MSEALPKDELAVIFSEDCVKFGDKEYLVKPWTLRQLTQIWPILSQALALLKLELGLESASLLSELYIVLTTSPQTLIPYLLPLLADFISQSIKGVSHEEIDDMEIGPVTILLVKIVTKNIAHLKNSLSLVVREMATLNEAMTLTSS